jgi:hypothetical protein
MRATSPVRSKSFSGDRGFLRYPCMAGADEGVGDGRAADEAVAGPDQREGGAGEARGRRAAGAEVAALFPADRVDAVEAEEEGGDVGGAPGLRRHGGDEPGAEGAVGVAEREGEDEGDRRGPARVEVGEDRRPAPGEGPVEGDDAAAERGRHLFREDDRAGHPPFADQRRPAGVQCPFGARGAQATDGAGRQPGPVEHAEAIDFDRDPSQRRRRAAAELLHPAADRDRDRRRPRPREEARHDAAAEGHLQAPLPHRLATRPGGQQSAADQHPEQAGDGGRPEGHKSSMARHPRQSPF